MTPIASLRQVALGICLLAASGAQAQDGDSKAGKYAFSTCSGCHAVPGYANAYPTYHVPRLGGQHPQYIIAALKAYQANQRDHDTMHANAYDLSEADMANIAAYTASFKMSGEVGPIKGDPEEGQKKAAVCAGCHGEKGESEVPGLPWPVPRLSGQFETYLEKSLLDYRSKAREDVSMNPIASALSDQDISDLSAWYASQQPGLAVIEYDGSE